MILDMDKILQGAPAVKAINFKPPYMPEIDTTARDAHVARVAALQALDAVEQIRSSSAYWSEFILKLNALRAQITAGDQ